MTEGTERNQLLNAVGEGLERMSCLKAMLEGHD